MNVLSQHRKVEVNKCKITKNTPQFGYKMYKLIVWISIFQTYKTDKKETGRELVLKRENLMNY